MAKDDSEEKTLPASAKKLREARKKGQVAKSKDLVSGVALCGALFWLLLAGGSFVTAAAGSIDRAADLDATDFHAALAALLPSLWTEAMHVLAPLAAIVVGAVVLTSMAAMKGVPFSVEPIVPKPEKISPVEGFKRMFAMRSLVELIKSLVKAVIIVAVLAAVLAGGVRALVLVPGQGLEGELGLFVVLLRPFLGAAALVFLIAGGADAGLQRWLFLRDQKMSITERKRERKDMEGDPHLKRERKRIMQEALRLAGGLGLRRATVIVHDGGELTVGLRFKMNEMPAPVVVCRARGERGGAMRAEAAARHLPMAEDADLATELYRVPPGHGIPEQLFRPVALALRRAGMV